jgi:hypothetical protein
MSSWPRLSGIVLLARGEQRARGVDGDLETHIGLGHAVGDDLRDLVANVLRRPLVRQAQFLAVAAPAISAMAAAVETSVLFIGVLPKRIPTPIEADSLSHAMFHQARFLYTIDNDCVRKT